MQRRCVCDPPSRAQPVAFPERNGSKNGSCTSGLTRGMHRCCGYRKYPLYRGYVPCTRLYRGYIPPCWRRCRGRRCGGPRKGVTSGGRGRTVARLGATLRWRRRVAPASLCRCLVLLFFFFLARHVREFVEKAPPHERREGGGGGERGHFCGAIGVWRVAI